MTGKARRAAQDRLDRAASNPHGVKVGQVWKDNDPRYKSVVGRRLLVQSVTGAFAQCAVLNWKGEVSSAKNSRGELRRELYPQIRLDRFNGTRSGYVLDKDVTP